MTMINNVFGHLSRRLCYEKLKLWNQGNRSNWLQIPSAQYQNRHIYNDPQRFALHTDEKASLLDCLKRNNMDFKEFNGSDRKLINKIINRRFRNENKLFLVEGSQLIYKALKYGFIPKNLYYFYDSDLESILREYEWEELNYENVQWSKLDTERHNFNIDLSSFKCIGIFNFREPHKSKPDSALPLTLILDVIKHPDNLGSILRTAANVSIRKIILTKGSCDLWNLKTIKSSLGGVFQLDISHMSWEDINKDYNTNSTIYIAEKQKEAQNSNSSSDIIENKLLIPNTSLYETEFCKNEDIFLIIGGENGISEQGYDFALKNTAYRLCIPQEMEVNSLNSAVSSGIILYELKRQLDFKKLK